MSELLDIIRDLIKSGINKKVKERIREFKKFKHKSSTEIFTELSFCIMTANCSAEKCIEVHERIRNGFCELEEENLSLQFKKLGYRFPNIRAKYIVNAREYKEKIYRKIQTNANFIELREWLVKNIKGLGYKEASHFLRNIGFEDYAIIDFHIIDLLIKFNLIKRPKTLTKNKYLEIEGLLREISECLGLTLAELDLYMWYLETRKILK
ncbi:MAG: N-glycosylase/DNA lyase [Promethearchaeota archaeon]